MSENRTDDKRVAHEDLVARALSAVGTKDLDGFMACMHDELAMEVPFDPDFAPTDKAGLRTLTEKSFRKFKSLSITPGQVYQLVDADRLIAEYTSKGLSSVGNVTYANRYISVFEFTDGLISSWYEYTSPLVWREAKAKMDIARAAQKQGAAT